MSPLRPGRRAALASLLWLGLLLALPRRLLAQQGRVSRDRVIEDLIRSITAGQRTELSAELEIKAPALAEDGSVVPVSLSAGHLSVESLSLVARHNPSPLLAQFVFHPGAKPVVSLRIKLQQSGDLQLLAVTKAQVYESRAHVEVAQGGCS